MAEGDVQLEYVWELIKRKLIDIRFVLVILGFLMSFLAVFASIRSDWIIIGPVADFINNNLLRLFGPFIQLLLILLIAAFFFELVVNGIMGDRLTISGFISTILVCWIVYILFLNVAVLFGTGDSIYSVVPVVNSIVGP